MTRTSISPAQQQLLETLARQMRRLEHSVAASNARAVGRAPCPSCSDDFDGQGARPTTARAHVSERRDHRTTGVAALDELLGEWVLPPARLMEWLEPERGTGVDTLALWA